jgi:fibro-slime domain-containing protein
MNRTQPSIRRRAAALAVALGIVAVAACGGTGGIGSDGAGVTDDDSTGAGGEDPGSGSGGFDPGSTGGDGGTLDPTPCGKLTATVRDFQSSHPDFETYLGDAAYTGIVASTLGPDHKPVYAHDGPTDQTSGPGTFAQWYNDAYGVNQAFEVTIQLVEMGAGVVGYDDGAFFPLDGIGFGNEGNPHNYHFTTEIHAEFSYHGGEIFQFTGDDDLWLFINGRLALDLGGLHPQIAGLVDLDAQAAALGIEPGTTYPMDIFHAERHTTESNFRVQTTIDCFVGGPR